MSYRTLSKSVELRSNRNRVFCEINSHECISKQELASRLKLSLPTIAQYLKELYALGIIDKNGYFESTGGRKPQMISVFPGAKYAIGAELLRESIKLTALDLRGNTVKEAFYDIPFMRSPEYYKRFGDTVNSFSDSLGVDYDKILGVGIAVQGLVSEDGESIISGDILGYTGTKRSVFQDNLRLKCRLFHDTEVACFAELWDSPEIKNAVYIALNRNMGGALIVGGQVYLGLDSYGCIIEHMRLHPGGRKCYCGQSGCLEAYCSVNSLEKDAGTDVDGFFELLDSGDKQAEELFNDYLGNLALAINNIQMVFDFEFILGGFLEPYLKKEHLTLLESKVKDLSAFKNAPFNLRRGMLGPSAASKGAALVLLNDYVNAL